MKLFLAFIPIMIFFQLSVVLYLVIGFYETGDRDYCNWTPKTPAEVVGSTLSYPIRKTACFLTWEFEK